MSGLYFVEYYPAAFTLAEKAHEGQYYDGWDYFRHHVCGVANNVAHAHQDDPDVLDAVVVALLHDVLEDCSEIGPYELAAAGIPEDLRYAVYMLTHTRGPYEDYIKALVARKDQDRTGKLAFMVKEQDLRFNYEHLAGLHDIDQRFRLKTKYENAAAVMGIAL